MLSLHNSICILTKPLVYLTLLALLAGGVLVTWMKSESYQSVTTKAKNTVAHSSLSIPVFSTDYITIQQHNNVAKLINLVKAVRSLEDRLTAVEFNLSKLPLDLYKEVIEIQEIDYEFSQEKVEHESKIYLNEYDSIFDNQGVDTAWAGDTESLLSGLILNHAPEETHILSLECREKTCRMEVEHADSTAESEFSLILNKQSMGYYLQNIDGAEGESLSVIYLDRVLGN